MTERRLLCLLVAINLHAIFGIYLYLQKEEQKPIVISRKIEVAVRTQFPDLTQPKTIPVIPSIPTSPIVPIPAKSDPVIQPKPTPPVPTKPRKPLTKKTEAPKNRAAGEKPVNPAGKSDEPPPVPKGEEGKKPGESSKEGSPDQPGSGSKGDGGGKPDGTGTEGSPDGKPGGIGGGKGGTGTEKDGKGDGKGPYTEEGVKKIPEHDAEECGSTMQEAWSKSEEHAEGMNGVVIVQILVTQTGKVSDVKILKSFSKSKQISSIVIGNFRFNPKCRFSPAIDHQGNKVPFLIEQYKITFESKN